MKLYIFEVASATNVERENTEIELVRYKIRCHSAQTVWPKPSAKLSGGWALTSRANLQLNVTQTCWLYITCSSEFLRYVSICIGILFNQAGGMTLVW